MQVDQFLAFQVLRLIVVDTKKQKAEYPEIVKGNSCQRKLFGCLLGKPTKQTRSEYLVKLKYTHSFKMALMDQEDELNSRRLLKRLMN